MPKADIKMASGVALGGDDREINTATYGMAIRMANDAMIGAYNSLIAAQKSIMESGNMVSAGPDLNNASFFAGLAKDASTTALNIRRAIWAEDVSEKAPTFEGDTHVN